MLGCRKDCFPNKRWRNNFRLWQLVHFLWFKPGILPAPLNLQNNATAFFWLNDQSAIEMPAKTVPVNRNESPVLADMLLL